MPWSAPPVSCSRWSPSQASSVRHHGDMRRHLMTTVLVVLGVASSACSAYPAGCGPCKPETQALRQQIAHLPDVKRLTYLQFAPRRNIERAPVVNLEADVAAGSLDRVRPAVVRAAWDSRITPLDYVNLTLHFPTGRVVGLRFTFAEGTGERRAFEHAWGKRKVDQTPGAKPSR